MPGRVATVPQSTGLPRVAALLGLAFLASGAALLSLPDDGLVYLSVTLLGIVAAGTVLSYPVAGVLLMIANFIFVYSKYIPMVRPFTPNIALGALLAFALLLKVYRERDFWFLKSPPLLLLGAIGILYTVSTEFGKAAVPHLPTGHLIWEEQTDLEKLLTRWAFLLFLVYFVRTRRQLNATLFVLFGLLYAAVPASFMKVISGRGWGGYRARAGWLIHSAGNPNRLAFLCLFAAVIAWYFLSERKRKVSNWLGMPLLVSLFAGAIATGSRSGFFNTLVVGALLAARGRGVRLRNLALGLIVLGCTAVVVSELVPEKAIYRATAPVVDIHSDIGQRSAAKRLHTVRIGAKIFREHPWLGVGMGNFLLYQQAIDPKAIASSAHNSYVLTLTEGGIVVFGLYLTLFYWCLRSLARIERRYLAGMHREMDLLWLVRALRVNFILFLSFSLFASVWIHIILYIMIGAVVVLRRLHGEREHLPFHTLEVAR